MTTIKNKFVTGSLSLLIHLEILNPFGMSKNSQCLNHCVKQISNSKVLGDHTA